MVRGASWDAGHGGKYVDEELEVERKKVENHTDLETGPTTTSYGQELEATSLWSILVIISLNLSILL